MMLATNKEIKSKDDVIKIAKLYFSRWRIEEYFRCKKQMFQFENFRVRKLKAINALNFYITLCMAFLAHISMKPETNALKVAIIKTADPIKVKISFCYYRLAKGISGILSYAKEGIRLWFRRNVLHTVNSVLSWLFKYIKICLPKSGSGGLIKVPNHRTAILNFSKSRQIGTLGRHIHF